MKRLAIWLLMLVLLAGAGIAYYVWRQGPTYRTPLQAPTDVPPPPAALKEPEIHYPVVGDPVPQLPPLEQSDGALLSALAGLFGRALVREVFQPQEIVRRIVVTLDNLPRQNVSGQLLPNRPVPGKLRTTGEGGELALSEANHERYQLYVRMMETVDVARFAAAYHGLYPLFQQAYRDLGYPKGYFNDRLVAVIDHLLAAPRIEGPVALQQPHVFYRFADPALESLSAGHKLMIRMGNENADRVKAKLRELRRELVAGGAAAPAGPR